MSDIRGSVVVITGVSSGIGAELAVQYGRLGARLALTARRDALLQQTAAEARTAGSPDVFALATDMSSREAVERFINATMEHFGRIDVLLLNHASVDNAMLIEYNTTSDVEKALDVVLRSNVYGSVFAVHAALPHLEKAAGHVAIVSSASAHVPAPFHAAYVASKRALNGYFDTVRHELRLAGKKVTIGVQVLGMIGTKEVMADPGNAWLAIPVPQCAYEMICAVQARVDEVNVPLWYGPLIGVMKLVGALSACVGEEIINRSYIFNSAEYIRRINAAAAA